MRPPVADATASSPPSAPPHDPMVTTFFYVLALALAQLVGDDICDDCNYPVDDGCKCVCYSGGYDPDDPACQF